MDRIVIRGIEAFGNHGVLPHERELGQRFVIDLALELDLAPAAAADDLGRTVDYGAMTQQVSAIVADAPVDLIETLAERIASHALSEPRVAAVEVTVHKPNAPLPTIAHDIAVTIHRTRP